MANQLRRVRIAGTGSFLPNAPVGIDRIDDVLGHIHDAPKRVQSFMQSVGRRMLEHGGVQRRFFAIDPETHELTHSVAGLAEPAARAALADAGRRPEDVDLLLISSPSSDRSTPPTSALLQARLGIERCAEMEIHSNCSGMGKAMQVAYDSLRVGRYRTALVVYSQLSSAYLRAAYFNQAKMTKTQAALRYILSDGAGAAVLESCDCTGDDELRTEVLGTYVESIGGRLDPAMTCGGAAEDVMTGANPAATIYDEGRHHLDQDFAAVNRLAGANLFDGMMRMFESLRIEPRRIDHYIWSIPTMQLYDENVPALREKLGARPEQLQFRTASSGYCGGASMLIHLDQMAKSGELQPGQTAAVYSVESSKWMSAGFVVRW
ncbi:MAG: hypothetical protein D6744_00010 [Planctomycetota bacterium]|nr:MAG: hypothetical protein D6744_00010 [Planctomycetota bacterium]